MLDQGESRNKIAILIHGFLNVDGTLYISMTKRAENLI